MDLVAAVAEVVEHLEEEALEVEAAGEAQVVEVEVAVVAAEVVTEAVAVAEAVAEVAVEEAVEASVPEPKPSWSHIQDLRVSMSCVEKMMLSSQRI